MTAASVRQHKLKRPYKAKPHRLGEDHNPRVGGSSPSSGITRLALECERYVATSPIHFGTHLVPNVRVGGDERLRTSPDLQRVFPNHSTLESAQPIKRRSPDLELG
jgi:hypothetical protein